MKAYQRNESVLASMSSMTMLVLAIVLSVSLAVTAPAIATDSGTSAGATRQVLEVGAGRRFSRPSEAARIASDGAVVEIMGDYIGDVAVWTQDDLTLLGVGRRPHLRAGGKSAEGKAIWVIKGDRVTVENLEFSGARVASRNGAGIRAEGGGLTIFRCRLHHNEMGLLTNNRRDGFVIITDSEFDHNRSDTERHGRLGHNIYIGRIERFVLRGSHVHGALTGHQVKTRARHNEIRGNRIQDGDGAGSYLLDISEGGQARIIANQFEQSARAANRTAIAFAPEASDRSATRHSLTVRGNSFINQGGTAIFVRNFSSSSILLEDNRLPASGVVPVRGPGDVR